MQHEQRLRRPALCRPHRPLLSRVFPVATAIKVHDAVRSRIRWAFVQGQLCDIRNDTYGMSPRFHVYRLHPLGRCEGEHRNGLSFGFGLVHFRRGHCRLVDEGRVGALFLPRQVQPLFLSVLVIPRSSLVRTLSFTLSYLYQQSLFTIPSTTSSTRRDIY